MTILKGPCRRSSLIFVTIAVFILIVYSLQVLLPLYDHRIPKVLKEVGTRLKSELGAAQQPFSHTQDPDATKTSSSLEKTLLPQPPKDDGPKDLPSSSKTLPKPSRVPASDTPSSASATPVPSDSSQWIFNTTRDARAYTLTTEQCNAGFPGLFSEIDRAVAYRKNIGKITPEDTDISWREDGAVRAMIFDQQLYILESKFGSSIYGSTRALALLHSIHRSILTAPTPVPNIEFSFSPSDLADPDRVGHSIWALSRTEDQPEKWLMSDFGYWSWPVDLVGGYEEIRREMKDTKTDFQDKIQKVVWRGSVKTNEHRRQLIDVTNGKEWADVKGVDWANETVVAAGDVGNALSISDHCKYMFVVQTEGHSYSGRGKYLQNCDSVVLIPTPRTWLEPHHPLLVASGEGQNFVEIKQDFSDLEEKILALLSDLKKAKSIATASTKMFRDRYLTSAAQTCYWRRMFDGWAEVSFEPEGWEALNDGTNGRRVRGIPFETFSIQRTVPIKQTCVWWRKILFQC